MSGQWSGRLAALAVALVCLMPSGARAETANSAASKLHGPVVITSARLQADRREGVAVFEGGVVASSEDFTLSADRMTVFYGKEGDLDRIEADGSVKLVKDTRVLTSDHAVYEAGPRKVTFTGNPRAVDKGNVLVGTSMVYMVDEERFSVEGSRIIFDVKDKGAK